MSSSDEKSPVRNNKENKSVNILKKSAHTNQEESSIIETLITSVLELYPELKLKSKRSEGLR